VIKLFFLKTVLLHPKRLVVISKEQAIQSVLDDYDDDWDIDKENIVEKDYGWVLFPEPQAFGSGGTLVEKRTGRKIQFGSFLSLSKNLRMYELGYMEYESWDIIVEKVHDKAKAANLLCRLEACYVIREEEYGDMWKTSTKYTEKQIKILLKALPMRLSIGCICFKWEIIESLKNQAHFCYSLEGNQGYENIIPTPSIKDRMKVILKELGI